MLAVKETAEITILSNFSFQIPCRQEESVRKSLTSLQITFIEAGFHWLRLSKEHDCWTNRTKKHKMLKARLQYQEAKLEFFTAQQQWIMTEDRTSMLD